MFQLLESSFRGCDISTVVSRPADSTMFRSSSGSWTGRYWKANSIRSTPIPEGRSGLRAPERKSGRRAKPATLSAKLVDQAALEARAGGEFALCFDGHPIRLGKFEPETAKLVQRLQKGLPFASFVSGEKINHENIHRLVRRLAARGLLEYRLASSPDAA